MRCDKSGCEHYQDEIPYRKRMGHFYCRYDGITWECSRVDASKCPHFVRDKTLGDFIFSTIKGGLKNVETKKPKKT